MSRRRKLTDTPKANFVQPQEETISEDQKSEIPPQQEPKPVEPQLSQPVTQKPPRNVPRFSRGSF